MATVQKTFAFATDAEGLTDQAISAVAFAYVSADGNPAGCVGFTQATKSVTHTEKGRGAGTTWESFGVPTGSTVNTVRVVSYDTKVAAISKLTSHSHVIRFVDGAGATIGGNLAAETLGTATTAWVAGGGIAAAQTVSQASTATALFEVEYTVTTSGGGGAAATDARFDQMLVEIDYAAANNYTQALTGAVTFAGGVTTTHAATATLTAELSFTGELTPTYTAGDPVTPALTAVIKRRG